MNCLFCQQPVQTVKTTNGAPCEEGETVISDQYCVPCQTHYHHNYITEELSYYHFDYQNFRIFFHSDSGPLFHLWKDEVLVLELAFLPTITPQNIATRLPLLLAFL
jgi:hypothetical protein